MNKRLHFINGEIKPPLCYSSVANFLTFFSPDLPVQSVVSGVNNILSCSAADFPNGSTEGCSTLEATPEMIARLKAIVGNYVIEVVASDDNIPLIRSGE